jgi:predicted nucleic acid-binding protein
MQYLLDTNTCIIYLRGRNLGLKRRIESLAKPLLRRIALVHDLTLVTHNIREFARVEGLRMEDWDVLG